MTAPKTIKLLNTAAYLQSAPHECNESWILTMSLKARQWWQSGRCNVYQIKFGAIVLCTHQCGDVLMPTACPHLNNEW